MGNPGIWILVAGGAPLISLPADTIDALGDHARAWSAAHVADVATLQRELTQICPRTVDKIVGPAFIGYGSADSLDLRDASLARPISSHAEVRRLQAACQPEEWDHGGSEPEHEHTFGFVGQDNELLALSGYKVWNDSIAHISIVTHPLHRGRGHGRAAVALAAQQALTAGLLPQYRTLRQNTPSMNIAKRLGFIEYGFSVYVRLRAG
jgi:GNAT superfamily N-acetyltransferase